MKDSYCIRKAGIEDIPVIMALAESIWPVTYKDVLAANQIRYMLNMMYSEDALHTQMTSKGHIFLVIESEGKPAGFASYAETGHGQVYKLHKIYIDPLLQGKGLGKMIISHVMKSVKASGGVYLELNVNRNNKAKAFYEKLGFAVIGEEDINIGEGYWMNDYVMRREV